MMLLPRTARSNTSLPTVYNVGYLDLQKARWLERTGLPTEALQLIIGQ